MPSKSSHLDLLREQLAKPGAAASDVLARRSSPAPMPVLRPKLPSGQQLESYLQTIDASRIYSNGGPLSLKLLAELSRHLGCAEHNLATAASATAGITTALLALDLPPKSICLMPSWTFAATPHAALAAGMLPWFFDVNRRTWALDPKAVRKAIQHDECPARAIVVVSPFGAPVDVTAWQALQEETGIPVLVDAAAGFDTVRVSSLSSIVSLHATKMFAAGEGGFVVAPNAAMRDRVRACSNFGFEGSRVAQRRAINSKLSEYHAAVALASFEAWPANRLRHLRIATWYRQALAGLPGVSLQPSYGEGWACGTTNVLLESDSAESISRHMFREGIETRMWWGTGCHSQPAFEGYPRGDLSATEYLGARVLGLPHFIEMERCDVLLVAKVLSKALTARSRGRRRITA